MKNRLFVGNIPWKVNDEDISKMFSEVGEVIFVKVVKDKDTGHSKGFAFVEMKTEADAKKVIDVLNDADLGGRQIRIQEAKPLKKNYGIHKYN